MMVRLAAFLAMLAALAASPALALDKVSFGLNWVPEAEHCGFFQARATGLYERAGLDVELRPGNPNVNMPLLVASGELDMGMGSSFTTLNLVAKGIKRAPWRPSSRRTRRRWWPMPARASPGWRT